MSPGTWSAAGGSVAVTVCRNRFAVLANRHRRSLGDELDALLTAAERQEFWEQVSGGYARVAAGPRDPYDAVEEFPEYADLRAAGPLVTPEELHDEIPDYLTDRASA